jgi:hypothetical protein
MTDKGEPGENDKIGITLWRVNSKGKLTDLLYSSAWSGANTTEKLLAGGNLVVHSGFSFWTTDSGLKSALIDPANVQPVIKVYPNPFIDRLLFEFVSPDDTQAHIDVYDITGRLVRTVFDGTVEEGVTYNAEFIPAESSTGIYLYRLLLGDMVYTGKVICRR